MRSMTLGKPMEAHRHDKHSAKKSNLPPLLVCWLIAVGLMLLVSNQGNSATRTTGAAPAHSIGAGVQP